MAWTLRAAFQKVVNILVFFLKAFKVIVRDLGPDWKELQDSNKVHIHSYVFEFICNISLSAFIPP